MASEWQDGELEQMVGGERRDARRPLLERIAELEAERDKEAWLAKTLNRGMIYLRHAMETRSIDRISRTFGGNTPEDWCGVADALSGLICDYDSLIEERDELAGKLAQADRERALERSATNHGTYAICAKHPKEFSIGKPRGAQCRECMAEKLAKLSAFVESVSKAANCPTMDGRAFGDWVEHAAEHYNRADDKILWHEEADKLAEKLAVAREALEKAAADLSRMGVDWQGNTYNLKAQGGRGLFLRTTHVDARLRDALAQLAPEGGEDEGPEGCDLCRFRFWGPGALDDPLSSAAGGRPYRPCDCVLGIGGDDD